MTPQEALADVCRHFCADDSAGKRLHDDACSALRIAIEGAQSRCRREHETGEDCREGGC